MTNNMILKAQIPIALLDARLEFETDRNTALCHVQILLDTTALVELRCAWLRELSIGQEPLSPLTPRQRAAAQLLGQLGAYQAVENERITIDELAVVLGREELLRAAADLWKKSQDTYEPSSPTLILASAKMASTSATAAQAAETRATLTSMWLNNRTQELESRLRVYLPLLAADVGLGDHVEVLSNCLLSKLQTVTPAGRFRDALTNWLAECAKSIGAADAYQPFAAEQWPALVSRWSSILVLKRALQQYEQKPAFRWLAEWCREALTARELSPHWLLTFTGSTGAQSSLLSPIRRQLFVLANHKEAEGRELFEISA